MDLKANFAVDQSFWRWCIENLETSGQAICLFVESSVLTFITEAENFPSIVRSFHLTIMLVSTESLGIEKKTIRPSQSLDFSENI